MMLRKLTFGIAAMAAVVALVQPVAAKEFVYGAWVSARHGVNVAGLQPYFAAVAKDTGGAVTWKLLAGGQIVSARSTLPGVRDRIVDAGMVIPVFNRKQLAHSNLLFDMGMFGANSVAIAGSSIETVMLDCPECRAEYRKHKTVYLGGFGTTSFKFICAKPITTLAQIKGVKTRAVGANSRWVKAMGGIPVAMSPTDGVTAMQRGALTCLHGPIAWLRSYGYMDVAKTVLDYPMGTPRALAMMAMNRKSWDSLSLSEKKVMLKHLPAATARATLIGYVAEDVKIKQAAMKRGIKFVSGGKEFDDLMARHRKREETAVPKALKKLGVKADTAKRLMAAAIRNLKKWEKIAARVGNDVDAFAAALKTEIYDKIDPSKL